MKRAILLCVAVAGLAMLAGCVYDRESCPRRLNNNAVDFPEGGVQSNGSAVGTEDAEDASGHHCLGHGCLGRRGADTGDDGAVGGVTYPYYTIRGPRDFLQRTPTPIGP